MSDLLILAIPIFTSSSQEYSMAMNGVKILKTSKSHFTIRSDLIKPKALYDHYLDLPILRTSANLEYYYSHSVDFFQIVLHLSYHMIIGCRHPECLTTEYTFVFIAMFSYLLCFTFLSVLKSVQF